MIQTNTRLSKLAAAQVEFGRRGMLKGDVLTHALWTMGLDLGIDDDDEEEEEDRGNEVYDEDDEVGAVDGEEVQSFITLPRQPAYSRWPNQVAVEIGQPSLPELICCFLYDQLYPDDDLAGVEVPLAECPVFQGRVSVYHSASATFYAPSELAGPGGMH
ncbi:hypothetical protein PAXINDRAFT_7797 [Paxillus involutus ATCC 200175]|nr:hypothetical protein PAXINDRAFT_7797 [Paxillus involutus ATCC 200175]